MRKLETESAQVSLLVRYRCISWRYVPDAAIGQVLSTSAQAKSEISFLNDYFIVGKRADCLCEAVLLGTYDAAEFSHDSSTLERTAGAQGSVRYSKKAFAALIRAKFLLRGAGNPNTIFILYALALSIPRSSSCGAPENHAAASQHLHPV